MIGVIFDGDADAWCCWWNGKFVSPTSWSQFLAHYFLKKKAEAWWSRYPHFKSVAEYIQKFGSTMNMWRGRPCLCRDQARKLMGSWWWTCRTLLFPRLLLFRLGHHGMPDHSWDLSKMKKKGISFSSLISDIARTQLRRDQILKLKRKTRPWKESADILLRSKPQRLSTISMAIA